MSFRRNHDLEEGAPTEAFDGMVLEIAINGGAFTDILTAGGSFVTGGYTHTVSTGFSNPLATRMAWSGITAGYVTTTFNLPAAAAGQRVQLRWRVGTDSSVSRPGVRIDTITATF